MKHSTIPIKAYIYYKGEFKLKFIGNLSKRRVFKFRNKQLKKACLDTLKQTFDYECLGGSLTIPDLNRDIAKFHLKSDGHLICYTNVMPEFENSKYLVTYWKSKEYYDTKRTSR